MPRTADHLDPDLDLDLCEEIFGPPATAAADLNELRAWAQTPLSLQVNGTTAAERELCRRIDPTWPARGLTNEKALLTNQQRPKGYGLRVDVVDSTIEVMMTVAEGRDHRGKRRQSYRTQDRIWPAQSASWLSWVSMICDNLSMSSSDNALATAMLHHVVSVDTVKPYIHPARFAMAVRAGGTPYLDAIGERMEVPKPMWRFGCTMLHEPRTWLRGLYGFRREHLEANQQLTIWLRSLVGNGFCSSHQVAWHMDLLPTARSCEQSWIETDGGEDRARI